MSTTIGDLRLTRVDADHWVIQDHSFPPTDARHVVACVREDDGVCVEVGWVQPIPLPLRYLTPADAVDDLIRWRAASEPGTKPVPIPHYPPVCGDG